LHGLSNAYITAGEHQKAIELLRTLVESKPENLIYRQSLATELFFLADQKLVSVATQLKNGRTLEETSFSIADSLLRQAENEFKQILEDNPDNTEIQSRLARFYQNSAAGYQRLLPLVTGQTAQL